MLPFADWLPRQRWYAGRHRGSRPGAPGVGDRPARHGPHAARRHLRRRRQDRYQVFVRWDDPQPTRTADRRRPPASVRGSATTADRRRLRRALRRERGPRDPGADRRRQDHRRRCGSRPNPVPTLPVDAPARVGDAEQSNTSVVFDSAAMLKLFRRVPPGINPDLELNRVLARAGSPHVARLLGAIESADAGRAAADARHGQRVRAELRRGLGDGRHQRP